ncbi:MAG: inositol monophosphatase [Calditrichaceae bacterium]
MINTAKKAAIEAGKILTQHFGNLEKNQIREKTKNDFLSFVDENSEKAILSVIQDAWPDHNILAEEGGEINQDSPYKWIIDPLDGTRNYICGIPVFSVSIGLQFDGEMILGIVYDPIREEMFWAEKDKGAFLNDRRIRVTDNENLSDSIIATGFPFKSKQFLPDYLKSFEKIFNDCNGIRRLGSAAIDLAYVAAGRFDGYWELGLSPWDMAAGVILIKEAGGMMTDFWNQPYYLNNTYVVASNGKIHSQIAERVQKNFPFFKPVYSAQGV